MLASPTTPHLSTTIHERDMKHEANLTCFVCSCSSGQLPTARSRVCGTSTVSPQTHQYGGCQSAHLQLGAKHAAHAWVTATLHCLKREEHRGGLSAHLPAA
jgi:hypothetical protein